MKIRTVKLSDLSQVAEIIHDALEPYYGGDHRAHAKRIVETASNGSDDHTGHFSRAQVMYVAEDNGNIIGVLNFVVKYQGTMKVSPLIVLKKARGKGVGKLLMKQVDDYAKKYRVRQIYCTIAKANKIAYSYFRANGFVQAGEAHNHYRPDMNEMMLYKMVEHAGAYTQERTISVRALEESDKDEVRHLILRRLSPFFEGVDDRWVDALFAGYERRASRDPNEKYKLIWVAKSRDGDILGVAAATPKKGNPIKLMPLVAENIQAFSALLVDLPPILREYGHKLYTHAAPSGIEVEALQHHGWSIEAMMPEAYKRGVVTQQWGLVLEHKVMKTMRIKRQYFHAIMSGRKPLEVRVGYSGIRKIRKGDNVKLECGKHSGIVRITDVRKYKSFREMLEVENPGHIAPDVKPDAVLNVLHRIYPANKEKLGVYVFEMKKL